METPVRSATTSGLRAAALNATAAAERAYAHARRSRSFAATNYLSAAASALDRAAADLYRAAAEIERRDELDNPGIRKPENQLEFNYLDPETGAERSDAAPSSAAEA